MDRRPLKRRDPHAHAIHTPGRRLLREVRLLFVARSAGGGGRRSVTASLNLASFIDFLVVTVVFLLMSFSASGECPGPRVDIPGAVSGMDMIDAPMISVLGDQILVDGVSAGSIRGAGDLGRPEKIPELEALLEAKRRLWVSVQPKATFPGAVVLQIDGDAPSIAVKSLFLTATAAGYPNVSFMVRKIPAAP
ncbi:MAG: biopolymer transporter ExbD [Polyangiaceae bacterium]|nr:biopolymer transporter ExbD [Polyangiaceae bacterium]